MPPKGKRPAGLWVLDVSDVERIRRAKALDDLRLSFFDTSGPNSQGAHCVWFVDGEFAHVTTGMPDFEPTHPNDHQIYVIVDLRNPRQPREVGRWWYPGTRRGDACLPRCLPVRNAKIDTGYRPHQTEVWPDHPDRAYVGYIDGGAFILDISGLADVKVAPDGTVWATAQWSNRLVQLIITSTIDYAFHEYTDPRLISPFGLAIRAASHCLIGLNRAPRVCAP